MDIKIIKATRLKDALGYDYTNVKYILLNEEGQRTYTGNEGFPIEMSSEGIREAMGNKLEALRSDEDHQKRLKIKTEIQKKNDKTLAELNGKETE